MTNRHAYASERVIRLDEVVISVRAELVCALRQTQGKRLMLHAAELTDTLSPV